MAKRKRTVNLTQEYNKTKNPVPSKKVKAAAAPTSSSQSKAPTTIQIVAGSYDRVLHGVTATISSSDEVQFADTFLFNAHTSAIRCLALSPVSAPVPKQTQKRI